MSTRGAINFQINNVIKATYNHSDSYPEFLGVNVANYLGTFRSKAYKYLKQQIINLRWVDETSKPSSQDIESYKQYSDLNVSNKSLEDWYCLLRGVQGVAALPLIFTDELEVLIDSSDFLKDSLFCEWAYIINFDENTFDTYRGFQTNADPTNPLGMEKLDSSSAYYPCKRIFQLPLKQLKTGKAWLKRLMLATDYKRE